MADILDDDPTVIQRILDHIDNNTTDLLDEVWREPVANYTSLERYQGELTRVMRRTATPFCPSAAIPEPGCYVARDAAQTPLVAVRGQDGVARVFFNACRHRGAKVVSDGVGQRASLSCRYHAWTYGLDGQLRGVPHEYGFPCLDKGEHGLVPVKTIERNGLVYVTQQGEAEPDTAIPDFFGPEWRLIDVTEDVINANWKVVIEGILEGYHIRSTHAETFYPRQFDNLTLIQPFGRNTRMTFPYRNIERFRHVPAAERKTSGVLSHVYHLFPNTAVSTFPTHHSLTVFEPLAIDRTLMVSYHLCDRKEGSEEFKAVQTGRDFVVAGVKEDGEVQASIQSGFKTPANDVLTFGLFEGGIMRFHKHVAAALSELG